MNGYLLILCFGFSGLVLMSLMGLGHHHHGGGGRHHGHARGHGHSAKSGRSANLLFTLISPRVIFGLLLGFGAMGALLHPLASHWPPFALPLLAITGAFLFEWYAVQPLWRLLFGFASSPAKTLESIVLEEGKAVSNFDATGCGLIAVDMDGQVRQLLGNLLPEERTNGGRVRAGDRVFIRAVDPLRNSCTVSRVH